MSIQLDAFADPALDAAGSEEVYELYKAALEWRLASPIVIRTAEDIVSAERWKDLVSPFRHQVRNLITFCRLAPSVLLADEVGLGKTVSAGLVLSELLARRRVARALVVCPIVLREQWVRELKNKFRIDAVAVAGSELLEASQGSAKAVVTSYESAARYLADPAMPTDEFQMLILDEAHRLRNLHSPNGPPKFAKSIRRVLEERWFTYVLMLTATPVQNRFTDIYSLIDLLTLTKGHRNPFGSPKQFREEYLLPGYDSRKLRPQKIDQFRSILNTYVTRTRRVDAELLFPTRNVDTLRVKLSREERELDKVVGDMVSHLNPLSQSSVSQALMSSPAALAAQLENMVETQPKLKAAARRARAIADQFMPAKLLRLIQLCDELARTRPVDWRVVVFTQRRETLEKIRQTLIAEGMSVGLIMGSRVKENQRDVDGFCTEPPSVHVLVSTDAGAEGINLQAANVLVNYDLPWNPMVLEQRIGRVQRLGSRHLSVQVLNLVASETVEEIVVARLLQKLIAVTETVGDLDSILAGIDRGAQDDAGDRFESVVRDLVVRSLQGQDVNHAAELQAANIERARREYEENCCRMNEDLGTLDASETELPPPTFDRRLPSVSAEKFVRRALAAEGWSLRDVAPGLLECSRTPDATSQKFAIVGFANDQVINDQAILYVPGQPAFERLVERWSGRASHRVEDLRGRTAAAAEQLARNWCAQYQAITFVSCSVRQLKPFVSGRVLVRTTAETRLDQHQQLIELPVSPEGHGSFTTEAFAPVPVLQEKVSLSTVSERATHRVRVAVAENEEIIRFCKYYASRRINELSRAGANPHLRQRVEDDYAVKVSAEVVGFRGASYQEAIIDVSFDVAGRTYAATLLAVPVIGKFIERPTEEHCQLSGLRMPYGVLERCDRTGRMFPKHLLGVSVISGRRVARDHLVCCDVTGRTVVDDEVEACTMTGKRVVPTELVTCVLTGKRILLSETRTSDLSGLIARKDLLRTSDLPPHRLGLPAEIVSSAASGKNYLMDEVVESEVSGALALSAELESCELTSARCLPTELAISSVSGRRYRADQRATSTASGRSGHHSEFVESADPVGTLANDEAEQAEVGGLWAMKGRLIASDVPPHRRVLVRDLLTSCVSGKRALANEMTQSEASGAMALPEEMASCRITGATVLPQELKLSELSGILYRSDQSVTSILSGRSGHSSEFVWSELPNGWIAKDEADSSAVSGRVADKKRFIFSDAKSQRRGLPDEVVVSAASGRYYLCDEVVASTLSENLALPEELATCAFTYIRVLPSELRISEISSQLYRHDQSAKSSMSGRSGHCSEFIYSELPSGLIAKDEAGVSDLSCRVAASDLLLTSEAPPHRRGLPDEFLYSAATGKQYLKDEVEQSVLSGSVAYPAELELCEFTGSRVLPTELVVSDVSGKKLRPDIQICSVVSRRNGHPSEFVYSVCPEGWVARDEAEQSQVGHEWGAKQNMVSSDRPPHRRGFPSEIVRCEATGRELLRDEVAHSKASGKLVDEELLVASAASGERALAHEMINCEGTGVWLLPNEANRCAVTGKLVDIRKLVRSSVSGLPALKSSIGCCAITGRFALLTELVRCEISGLHLLPELLETCDLTRRRARRELMHQCPTSQKWYIDDVKSREIVRTATGNEELIQSCQWTGKQYLTPILRRCSLTGLLIERQQLNKSGELAVFRLLLDGNFVKGQVDFDENSLGWLRASSQEMNSARKAVGVRSPNSEVMVATVRLKKGFFAFYYTHSAVVMRLGAQPALLQTPTAGKRTEHGWVRLGTKTE